MSTLTSDLNTQQQEAVFHKEGPALIIAGAGSGKTKILTLRIAHLIEKGVPPHQILAVTFTNKAASEMSHRLASYTDRRLRACTFHSLGLEILREVYPKLYENPPILFDELDSKKILKLCLDEYPQIKELFSLKDVRSKISLWKNALLSPEDILKKAHTSSERSLADIYQAYQDSLKKNLGVDFDDLLYTPVKIFQNYPHIKLHYQSKWEYLLVDEYQDTNHSQFQLICQLAEVHQNIFAVGDPDQSIYSWRGADIKNILQFEQTFKGASIFRLEQNYRSSTQILEAANHLIKQNEHRFEKDLWSSGEKGEKVFRYHAEDNLDEASFVADEIKYWVDELSIPLNEIAVLYRTNAQSQPFESTFLQEKIPHEVLGSISFYKRKEIKDLIAFLRLLVFDRDIISLMRALPIPHGSFGITTLNRLAELHRNHSISIIDLCKSVLQGKENFHVTLRAKQRSILSSFVEQLEVLKEKLNSSSIPQIVEELIHRFELKRFFSKDAQAAQERLENIQAFVEKAYHFEKNVTDSSLEELLNSQMLITTEENTQDTPKVSLMSLHHGKGLEFSLVFIVGLEESLCPHVNALYSKDAIEEERRLCYVGMTRAKKLLYLSHARYRYLWGEEKSMAPSRFFREIPIHLIQKVEWVID